MLHETIPNGLRLLEKKPRLGKQLGTQSKWMVSQEKAFAKRLAMDGSSSKAWRT